MDEYASGDFNKRTFYSELMELLNKWTKRSADHYDELCRTDDRERSLRLEGSSSTLLHCREELRAAYNAAKDPEGDYESDVIEAAKALQQAWMVGTPKEIAEAEDALGVALDALDTAEGRE